MRIKDDYNLTGHSSNTKELKTLKNLLLEIQ